jgi:F0F1-type ATP synthase membrane subunit b/b'
LADAIARKKEIIDEAKEIAEVKVHEIIAQANHEAEQIKKESEHVYLELHDELTNKFEDMVKTTAAAGIKKLIGGRAELNQKYLDEIMPK